MPALTPPRHIPTLPTPAVRCSCRGSSLAPLAADTRPECVSLKTSLSSGRLPSLSLLCEILEVPVRANTRENEYEVYGHLERPAKHLAVRSQEVQFNVASGAGKCWRRREVEGIASVVI
jgi:hypothetical protein